MTIKSRVQTFAWLLGHARRYRLRLACAMAAATTSALLAVVPMGCVYLIARRLLGGGDVASETVTRLALTPVPLAVIMHMGMNDSIILEKGRLVQTGRHRDLLAQEGLYARMWQEQQHPTGFQPVK